MKIKAPDLRKNFPRSPAERLGGFVLLARIIDKCRATLAGTNGEYNFNCPLDQRFFKFTKIKAKDFQALVATGATDEEIVAWVKKKTAKLSPEKIGAWNYDSIHAAPQEEDSKAYFDSYCAKHLSNKPHVATWFQMLDAEEGRL